MYITKILLLTAVSTLFTSGCFWRHHGHIKHHHLHVHATLDFSAQTQSSWYLNFQLLYILSCSLWAAPLLPKIIILMAVKFVLVMFINLMVGKQLHVNVLIYLNKIQYLFSKNYNTTKGKIFEKKIFIVTTHPRIKFCSCIKKW